MQSHKANVELLKVDGGGGELPLRLRWLLILRPLSRGTGHAHIRLFATAALPPPWDVPRLAGSALDFCGNARAVERPLTGHLRRPAAERMELARIIDDTLAENSGKTCACNTMASWCVGI